MLVASPPMSLDPRYLTDAVGVRLSRLAHAGLFGLDPETLEPVPLAAASYAWEGPLSLRVALRGDVSFASGAPFEAEDVCATLRALGDPALASPHAGLVEAVGRCEIVSPKEVRLGLVHERATLLTDLELPVLRRDEAAGPRRPEGGLDGLGPYAFGRVGEGTVELRARAGGALSRPAHDLNVRVVRDENARALRLLAGRADVVPNGLSAPLLGALEARGAIVRARPGANLTYLLPHHGRVPFRDVRARRAVSLGVERGRLARTLFEGRAEPARSFVPPGSWAHPPGLPPLPYDPAEAARLFAELGRPSASLLVSSDRARGVQARAIAQMLRDAGLAVEVVTLELGALLQRLTAGDFELALLQMPEITEPQLMQWFFHSGSIPGEGVGANRARYRNAAVDDRLERASRSTDREARRGLLREALGLMGDDLPVVPLFHEDQVVALSPRAASFVPSAEGRWLGLASLP
ncbi:MAG TPA: ABC transporter substrate-binding protein [Polyangiaceae bacterium]|nr:ABC transporter substrate-binding protein [Polyangiaceae bacterium]